MQYYIYRIHRYKAAERVLWTFSKGDAKHEINRLQRDNPRAKFEIRLSQWHEENTMGIPGIIFLAILIVAISDTIHTIHTKNKDENNEKNRRK